MKKLLTLFLIAFICGGTAYSQGFRIGLKAAPSISWLNTDSENFDSDGAKLRFGYGLLTEFSLNEDGNYAFATGLEIDYTGGALSYSDSVYYYKEEVNDKKDVIIGLESRSYNIQYITIPLTLKMKTNPVGAMSYFGQFGFNPSFAIKGMAKDQILYASSLTDSTVSKNSFSGEIDDVNIYKTNVAKFRIALNIGAGVEYNISGSTNLVASISFNNGFTNVLKGSSNDAINTDNGKIKEGELIEVDEGQQKPLETQDATSNYIALMVGVIF